MTPWHHHVIGIAQMHLALLFHTSATISRSVMIDFCLPRAKLCCFSTKSDLCDSSSRRSDGLRRSNRGGMKFNTFAGGYFLRLPRSCRFAEKSDPIGSREPKNTVFQQNPTVVTAQLDAPMDPDAVNAAA